MFSSTPQTLPLRSRAWGIALGTIIMVGVPAMIVSAKTVQVVLPVLLIAMLAGAVARQKVSLSWPSLNAASFLLLVFVFYAVLSGLWAPDSFAALSISLLAALIVVGSLTLCELVRMESAEDALHMGEGLWIGLLVGALYTVAEATSGQAIKIWVYNALALGPEALEPARYFTWEDGRLIAVHSDDLKRNAVPIPLLLWPALMTASALSDRHWRSILNGLLVLVSASAVFLATGQTAKLALVAGAIAFVTARAAPGVARYVIPGAWIIVWLGVVPAALLARKLELHNSDWLQLSAQLRIAIWNEVAQLVPQSPILGVGANMAYSINPVLQETPEAAPWVLGGGIVHPHNLYLQVWYELGLVGAGLLVAFGVVLLRQIARLETTQRAFGYALFATAAVQVAFSYNMWQIWFMCLFGFTFAMFVLGQNVLTQKAGVER